MGLVIVMLCSFLLAVALLSTIGVIGLREAGLTAVFYEDTNPRR